MIIPSSDAAMLTAAVHRASPVRFLPVEQIHGVVFDDDDVDGKFLSPRSP